MPLPITTTVRTPVRPSFTFTCVPIGSASSCHREHLWRHARALEGGGRARCMPRSSSEKRIFADPDERTRPVKTWATRAASVGKRTVRDIRRSDRGDSPRARWRGIAVANGRVYDTTLEIKQLRIFRTIVEVGSFTRAGDHLGLSQSAISQQVRTLEESLGVPLLVRAG